MQRQIAALLALRHAIHAVRLPNLFCIPRQMPRQSGIQLLGRSTFRLKGIQEV
ncbi:hypothetical protein [Sorlinia euscelidii]|uniref:hypothetical protein n=1 Tax=Sorlinia euscelidii TaxID=3081148 RepID=UPI00374E1FC4